MKESDREGEGESGKGDRRRKEGVKMKRGERVKVDKIE